MLYQHFFLPFKVSIIPSREKVSFVQLCQVYSALAAIIDTKEEKEDSSLLGLFYIVLFQDVRCEEQVLYSGVALMFIVC